MNDLKKVTLAAIFALAGIPSQVDANPGKLFRILGNTLTTVTGVFVIKNAAEKAKSVYDDSRFKSTNDLSTYVKSSKKLKVDGIAVLKPGSYLIAGFITTWVGIKGIIKELTSAPIVIKEQDEEDSKY